MIAEKSVWENEVDERVTLERLKEQYVQSLVRSAIEITSLRRAIHDLIEWGIGRRELVRWAVEAGYSTGYVRSLLCRILKDLGLRCRKRGAGRRVPREALALRILAQKLYGKRARKFLLAAYRADLAEHPNILLPQKTERQDIGLTYSPIVQTQPLALLCNTISTRESMIPPEGPFPHQKERTL